MAQQTRKNRARKPVKTNCTFCEQKLDPTFRDYDLLKKYITERGKINAASKTGTCAKHQRKLSDAIKHARHIALLPFLVTVR